MTNHRQSDADTKTNNIIHEIAEKGKNHDTDFSHVAQEIYDMHRHNPGSFKDEMKRVNEAFHDYAKANGLQQVDIVGSNGSDLVTRSADGTHTQVRDGKNISRATEQSNEGTKTASGVERPDGTSSYEVKKGDTGWSIAQQRLKDAGQIDDHTDKKTRDNLIANYVKESGLDHKHLHAGDKLDLPTVQKGGDSTSFGAERKMDDLSASAKQQTEQLRQRHEETKRDEQNIATALNAATRDGLNQTLSRDHVNSLLTKSADKLNDQEKAALKYVSEHWDKLKDFQKEGSGGTLELTQNSFRAGGFKRQADEATAQQKIDQTYLAMRGTGSDL